MGGGEFGAAAEAEAAGAAAPGKAVHPKSQVSGERDTPTTSSWRRANGGAHGGDATGDGGSSSWPRVR